ncbi:uncharacterized protein N7479_011053 [Penicillium vulpinum]|uniref:Uncharacterized protein n=1 Tax=Penicillium vulpinum TaxID=29845 RepID=A0A1V6RSV5_9EURO|nr:uncharacterized protein N7479_011053 [Penicillium vulpinum]KAJ5952640.1 hypothetical protein N7479_011053 [Penicillium vulpinum]OQE04867.1 hypothetical protein PENVUL_c029G02266 [Penicillium vulpinum]
MPPGRAQRYYNKISSTFTAWRRAERFFGTVSHANQVREFNSTSDIKQNQYLSLRVLTVTRLDMDQAEIDDLGLGAAYTDAAQWLAGFTPYTNYIQSVRFNAPTPTWHPGNIASNDLANMTSSRLQQIQVVRNLEEEHGDDEETVNLHLLL